MSRISVGRYSVILATCVMLILFLSASNVAGQTETPDGQETGSLFSDSPDGGDTAQAQALVQQGRLDEAVKALQVLLAASPENGEAWYLLGSTSYRLQRYELSAEAWGRAADLDYRAADARYSMACSLALAGRTKQALDALAAVLEEGVSDPYLIVEDPDLDSLRNLPRFAEIFTAPPPYRPHPDARPVELRTASGVRVLGELYLASAPDDTDAKSRPVVLLLHQAGSNSAEYLPIAPRLAASGYNALAIDARGGGRKFGRDNLTMAALGRRAGYDEAMEDFRTAMSFLRAEGFEGPLMVWGSSYSASLLFNLAMEGGVDAGLAFSPHPPVDADGQPIAPRFQIPVFVTWPEREFGPEQRAAFVSIASKGKVLFEQEGGNHGSLTLHQTNPHAEEIWQAVLAFLAENSQTSEGGTGGRSRRAGGE